MRLPPPAQIVLGLLTALPLAYVVYTLVHAAAVATNQAPAFVAVEEIMEPGGINRLDAAVLALAAALLAFYAWFLMESPSISRDNKALWFIALLMASAVAMPVFWFTHVLGSHKRNDSLVQ
jgi:hypothetical protein